MSLLCLDTSETQTHTRTSESEGKHNKEELNHLNSDDTNSLYYFQFHCVFFNHFTTEFVVWILADMQTDPLTGVSCVEKVYQ